MGGRGGAIDLIQKVALIEFGCMAIYKNEISFFHLNFPSLRRYMKFLLFYIVLLLIMYVGGERLVKIPWCPNVKKNYDRYDKLPMFTMGGCRIL